MSAKRSGLPVFWDGFGFCETFSGISTYAREIARVFPESQAKPNLIHAEKSSGGTRALSYPGSKLFWPVLAYQQALARTGQEELIFHGLSNINLPVVGAKKKSRFVITLHDLIPLLPESGVSVSLEMQFRIALPRVLRLADKIICVSDWTKDVLGQKFPWAIEKAVVIPNGSDSGFSSEGASTSDDVDLKENDVRVTLGTVSRFEPYKRIHWIPELLARLPEHFRWQVVTCQKGLRYLQKHSGDLQSKGRLRVQTGLDSKGLPDFYRSLDHYIHLSRYEGYGRPVGEALNYRKEVLWQRGSALDCLSGFRYGQSLPENAGLELWADAIRSLKSAGESSGLVNYDELLKPFYHTWGRAAKALDQVYNNLN